MTVGVKVTRSVTAEDDEISDDGGGEGDETVIAHRQIRDGR